MRGLILGRVSIHERPGIVGTRRRFGDWEGDTLYGSKTRQCLLTQLERKSRYLLASKIVDRQAATVAKTKLEQIPVLPNPWRRTRHPPRHTHAHARTPTLLGALLLDDAALARRVTALHGLDAHRRLA